MEIIKKEITVTRFVAFDGTEFKIEAECKHYEGSAFGQLIQQLMDCIINTSVLPDGRKCYCLVPKTRHDIFVIGQILKMAGNNEPCADIYDHLSLLTVKLNCNTVEEADVSNLENYIRDISNGQYLVVSNIKKAEPVKK